MSNFWEGFEKQAVSTHWAMNKIFPGVAKGVGNMKAKDAVPAAKKYISESFKYKDPRGMLDQVKDVVKTLAAKGKPQVNSLSSGGREGFKKSLRLLAGR